MPIWNLNLNHFNILFMHWSYLMLFNLLLYGFLSSFYFVAMNFQCTLQLYIDD
jgi:hypothetical protein